MTRMSRELSLVLLGSGALTFGYVAAGLFDWNSDEKIAAEADAQAQKRVGGNGAATTRHHGGMLLFISHGGTSSVSGGRSPAMASVAKGGFGSIGSRVGGGFGS